MNKFSIKRKRVALRKLSRMIFGRPIKHLFISPERDLKYDAACIKAIKRLERKGYNVKVFVDDSLIFN